MISQLAAKMVKSYDGSTAQSEVTHQSVLSDGRKALVTINDERIALQQDIERMFKQINQTITNYWTTQAKRLQQPVAKRDPDGEEWRIEFATQEALNAKAAAEKQKEQWSQIESMVQDAREHDHKYWASWQEVLQHLATSDESERESLPSRGVVICDQLPRRRERPARAAAKGSVPQGPTALSSRAIRNDSRLTKPSESTRSSALSQPSSPTKPTRTVADRGNSCLSEFEPSSSFPTPLASSANARKVRKSTRQTTTQRASTSVSAKDSMKSTPVKTGPLAKKRRALKSAKPFVNPDPVIDPKPGHLYQAYYHSADVKERGWYMGTVLPWVSSDWAKESMIDFSMRNMDLEAGWPDCCEPGYKTETILVNGEPLEIKELTSIQKWMPGFQDGGPRVMDRKFLFLFFEDRPKKLGCLNIDPTEPMALIHLEMNSGEPVPIDWVAAKDLRGWATDDGTMVRGLKTAEKYKNKLDHVDRLRKLARACPKTAANHEQLEAPVVMTGDSCAIHAASLGGSLVMPPQIKAHGSSQQNGMMHPFSSISPIEAPNARQHTTLKDEGDAYPSALSPGPMYIDEAYEEPQSYTKGKRPLSDDADEYDEGVGMDYDLNLKESAYQMSRPQTSIAGLPLKIPRLGDYDMPGPSTGSSGLCSPSLSYVNTGLSNYRPD